MPDTRVHHSMILGSETSFIHTEYSDKRLLLISQVNNKISTLFYQGRALLNNQQTLLPVAESIKQKMNQDMVIGITLSKENIDRIQNEHCLLQLWKELETALHDMELL